jgi:hypothetical protein
MDPERGTLNDRCAPSLEGLFREGDTINSS